MRRTLLVVPVARALVAIATLALPMRAMAQIPLGAAAPAFTKSLLGGGTVTPGQYSGKVLVLFLLGYS